MIAQQTVLEAVMLLSFGLAWPIANLRMLRSRQCEGKGLGFTLIILIGYAAGAAAKWISVGPDAEIPTLFWLYAVNGASVTMNLVLQCCFCRRCTGGLARLGVKPGVIGYDDSGSGRAGSA
jgi:hypothetical protein